MRVDVEPRRLSAIPGQAAVLTVNVANTGTVISGHRIRVLGVDPQWVRLDTDSLSLFPDSAGIAQITVKLPPGLPAGVRTLGIEVTELTPPHDATVVDVELVVPAELGLKLSLDPVSITDGRGPTVGVVLENSGNSDIDVHLEGADDEGAISFAFTPAEPTLAQGDQAIGTVKLKAHRPWFGSPKVRPFTVRAGPPRAPVIAFGAWVQKARLTRGMMALLGLLAAATVFAVVLTASLSQVVSNSNADRDLAIQVAQASQNANANGANSATSVTGTVTLLTSGSAVPGVTVELFTASNTTHPIVSTATGATGSYQLSGLAAGGYKLEFDGAGFSQLWYPDSLTPANAKVVTLNKGATTKGIDMRLGGLPATVSGHVAGGNAAGAVLTLEVPPPKGAAGSGSGAGSSSGSTAPAGTIVTTQTLGSNGDFTLANIPSPALYQLVVTKPGYAPAVQEVDLDGGQVRGGLTITLHQGNGSITGTVSSPSGALGGATISASDGSTTVSTVSVSTAGSVGTFVLSNLPTPAAFTLVVSDAGYATQTLSLSLSEAQELTGVAVSLTPGFGSISGTVDLASGITATGGSAAGASPTGDVTVTATNGAATVSTVTLSVGAIGTYTLSNLAVPGTYTVTFSRSDLASQTQALSLSATGPTNLTGIDATMVSKTASIFGTVTQTGGQGLGEVSVLLTSGTTSYQVTSASVPTPGAYEIDNVTPGTYTVSFTRIGGSPTSSIVTLTAGQHFQDNPTLNAAASIYGHVVEASNTSQPVQGVAVNLYLADQYPTVITSTILTDPQGNFTFPNVQAPQSYIVAFAYPQGASNQESVAVNVTLGTASPVCGSQATGLTPTTTASPPASSSSTTQPPVSAAAAPAVCDPNADPIQVTTS